MKKHGYMQVSGLDTPVITRRVSRVLAPEFPLPPFAVPESFRHSHGMARRSEHERKRVAEHARREMSEQGRDDRWLMAVTGIDPGTVRTFLAGETWPQRSTRQAIEDALGWKRGTFELIAAEQPAERGGDPVETAILRSRLTRANQHRLIGTYYDMLDRQGQGGGEHGSSAAM